tara:strand:+ start:33882 stop:34181 length:300 start_codon:yes stop_codon:yes gene_type:complete
MGVNTAMHERNTEIQIDLVEIDGKLQRMIDHLETMKVSQLVIAEDIAKIKEALFNPDQGIYARLREIENWKRVHTKLTWLLISALLGTAGALLISYTNS